MVFYQWSVFCDVFDIRMDKRQGCYYNGLSHVVSNSVRLETDTQRKLLQVVLPLLFYPCSFTFLRCLLSTRAAICKKSEREIERSFCFIKQRAYSVILVVNEKIGVIPLHTLYQLWKVVSQGSDSAYSSGESNQHRCGLPWLSFISSLWSLPLNTYRLRAIAYSRFTQSCIHSAAVFSARRAAIRA